MDTLFLLSAFLVSVVVTPEDDLRTIFESVLEDTLPHYIKSSQPPQEPPKEYLSNAEARAFLDVSKSTLQRWRDSGVLPYSKLQGSVYYAREDLLHVLQEGRVNGNS